MRTRGSTPAARRAVVATLAGALVVLVVLVRFAGREVTLDGDEAILAMQVHDAATGGFPTVGLYSRYGWNHPGPIAFYLLAPFGVFGRTWGVLIGAAAWNVAALAIAVGLAARRGGTGVIALVVAAQCAAWLSLGGAAVLDPWTPLLAAALVVPLLVAAWSAALGDNAGTAALLVLGSILPQVHIGYALFVGALALGVIGLRIDRRRTTASTSSPPDDPRRSIARPVLASAAIAVLLWVPVAYDAATGRTGNVSAVWRYFRDDGSPTAGWSAGAQLLAAEVGGWPTWLGGPRRLLFFGESLQRSAWWTLAVIAALVACCWRARRVGDRRAFGAAAVGLLAVGAGWLAASQLRGPRFAYLLAWRGPVLAFAALAVALTAAGMVRHPVVADRLRIAAAAVAATAVVAAAAAGVTAGQITRHGDEVDGLLDQLAIPSGESILVRLGDTGFVGVGPGVLIRLEAAGVDAGVDPALDWVFGDRTLPIERADEVWYAADTGWAMTLLSAMPGARLLARSTPFGEAEERRAGELQRMLADQLLALGDASALGTLDSPLVGLALAGRSGVDAEQVEELAKLNEQVRPGLRIGIVAFDPADAPKDVPWPLEGL